MQKRFNVDVWQCSEYASSSEYTRVLNIPGLQIDLSRNVRKFGFLKIRGWGAFLRKYEELFQSSFFKKKYKKFFQGKFFRVETRKHASSPLYTTLVFVVFII